MMSEIVTARVKGSFKGKLKLKLNDKGEIIDIIDVIDIADLDDIEITEKLG